MNLQGPQPARATRRQRMHARRRSRLWLGITVCVVVLAAVTVAVALVVERSGSNVSQGHDTSARRSPIAGSRTTEPLSIPESSTIPPTTTTDPGSLPQTGGFPSATTPQFDAEMSALWQGVVSGSVSPALTAFFPEAAYLQLKTISDAGYDYVDRLVANFGADISAAHTVLGGDASKATLLQVTVPEQYGHWIPSGVCDNRVGYYEVANSRIIYEEDGQTRSLGIASLISWRGVWYVVHFGAILRSSSQGVVDDPEIGPGYSSDSSTC